MRAQLGGLEVDLVAAGLGSEVAASNLEDTAARERDSKVVLAHGPECRAVHVDSVEGGYLCQSSRNTLLQSN